MEIEELPKSEKEWKKRFTPEKFAVLRKKGTDPPFTGKYVNNEKKGIYVCAGCGNLLFSSDAKFHSGSGWPSFTAPISPVAVSERSDKSIGMVRTEVVCQRCGGHLGHKFDDGPQPTGLRYCINSTSLDFKEQQ